jgi:chitodextrinase
MTRARALKHVIRARAAKTGERYTTARRHVLKSLHAGAVERPSPVAPPPKAAARPAARTKATFSDRKFLEKTGHGLDYWFDVLDRFGAVDKGHTATARYLYDVHKVDGWYAQGITVSYERARGVRQANQRCDGEFEVSVSKTMAGDAHAVAGALADPILRKRLSKADPTLFAALWQALDAPTSKGVVIRPDGLGRFRYAWLNTTVQLYLAPKAGGKVSVVATNMKLGSPAAVEERRGMWRNALNALAALVNPQRLDRVD